MINKRTLLVLFGLILLVLSACQPQVGVEQPEQAVGTVTATAVPATTIPTATPVPEASTPAPVPSTTIVLSPTLEAITPSSTPQATEELTMPEEEARRPGETAEKESADPPPEQPSAQPAPGAAVQPAVQIWIDQATEDLAQRLALSAAEIELLSFELRVWSDSSLGCPQPGMRYLQVPQDGYLIRLRTAGQIYDYHGGGESPPFLCEQPGPQIVITKQAPLNIKQTPTKSVPPPRD